MKKILIIAVVMSVAAFFTTAHAADKKMYVSGKVGANFANDIDFSTVIAGIPFNAEYKMDTGVVVGAAVGMKMNQIRLEAEFEYQVNDFDQVTATAGGTTVTLSMTGDVYAHSFLANLYYDIDTETAFTPYVGIGAGIANVGWDDMGYTVGATTYTAKDDSENVFAWKLGAGIGYELNENITLDLAYRYLGTSEPEFDGVDLEYSSHAVSIGARYNF